MPIKTHYLRWLIIALLFFISAVNYIDRSAIAYALPEISQTLHLNRIDDGYILGVFGIGYALTTLLGGVWSDRYGAKKVLLFATLAWSVATAMIGLVNTATALIIARFCLGLAEGPNFPALTRAITNWLAPEQRARALSFTLIAVPVSLALGAFLVSNLIYYFSWRYTFFVLSLLGLIWLPLWLIFFKNKPDDSFVSQNSQLKPEIDNEKISFKWATWKMLLTQPTLLTNYYAYFVFGYYLFFFMGWLPNYLNSQYHLNIQKIGLFSLMPWLLAAVLMACVGFLSDYLLKKTGNLRFARSHLIWISQALAALMIIPVVMVHNLTVAAVFISLAVAFNMSANGLYYAVNMDVTRQYAATALGIMVSVSAVSSFLSPAFTGYIVEATHNYDIAFGILVLLGLSSAFLVMRYHHP